MVDRERDVESYLKKNVEKLGGVCLKFIPDYARGMPDRVCLFPGGRVVWVELKTYGGELSGAQILSHTQLRRLGMRVEVIWSKHMVDDFIAAVKNEKT